MGDRKGSVVTRRGEAVETIFKKKGRADLEGDQYV